MKEMSKQRKLESEEMEKRELKMDGSRKDMFMLQGLTFFISCNLSLFLFREKGLNLLALWSTILVA
jgi:hypothetical protein